MWAVHVPRYPATVTCLSYDISLVSLDSAGDRLWLPSIMVERRKFSLPPEVDEILDLLPPQVTLNVPGDVLSRWFSAESANHGMDETTLRRAQSYARSCGCKFAYHASIREGVFYRLVSSPR
jgi:hypothetical protein